MSSGEGSGICSSSDFRDIAVLSDDDEQLDSDFKSASSFIRSSASKLGNDDLLFFYSRYKQAMIGNADGSERPSIWNRTAVRKFTKWSEIKGMSKNCAMREYVDKLTSLDIGWERSKKYGQGFGLKPSSMLFDEDDNQQIYASSLERSWHDFLEEGDVESIRRMAKHDPSLLKSKAPNGLNAILWSADRGNLKLLACLLELGANVNDTDESGQTPLHYAFACSHNDICQLLIDNGADKNAKDANGATPTDM